MSAVVMRDARRLEHAICAARAEDFFIEAVRHRCSGMLFGAINELKIPRTSGAPLRALLAKHAARSVLDSISIRQQIDGIVQTFTAAGIDHTLLKSAGRIAAGDDGPLWSQLFDVDVMVRQEEIQRAVDALHAAGYAAQYGENTVAGYRTRHHHWTPLVLPAGGKPVEVHVALARPGALSLKTDWNALAPHFERIGPADSRTYRLNRFGRALHAAIHGVGLTRLSDACGIALEVRDHPALLERLCAYLAEERIQHVPLLAVALAATRLAGCTYAFSSTVRRYASWVMCREDLPPALRGRVQLVEAWYANGGTIRGPATTLALPMDELYDGTRIGALARAGRIAGRAAAGFAATGYAALLLRR